MKFKPTLWKSIISVVFGLILGIYSSQTINWKTISKGYEFNIYSIIGFIIGFVIIYIIWSLFQKKK